MSNSDLAVVWMTTAAAGTPHAAALQAANPGLATYIHQGEDGATPEARHHLWRNCDRHIRDWWLVNRDLPQKRFLFLEWDVFCNAPLASILPDPDPATGITAAATKFAVRDIRDWPVLGEAVKLPPTILALACGIVPLGVALIPREALDAVIDPKWDAVFAADIFCELRLPTIIRAAGYRIAGRPQWAATVGVRPITPTPGASGIFHPVKAPVLP